MKLLKLNSDNAPSAGIVTIFTANRLFGTTPTPVSPGSLNGKSLGANAYRTRQAFGPNDSVSPLAVPTGMITVADLLP